MADRVRDLVVNASIPLLEPPAGGLTPLPGDDPKVMGGVLGIVLMDTIVEATVGLAFGDTKYVIDVHDLDATNSSETDLYLADPNITRSDRFSETFVERVASRRWEWRVEAYEDDNPLSRRFPIVDVFVVAGALLIIAMMALAVAVRYKAHARARLQEELKEALNQANAAAHAKSVCIWSNFYFLKKLFIIPKKTKNNRLFLQI